MPLARLTAEELAQYTVIVRNVIEAGLNLSMKSYGLAPLTEESGRRHFFRLEGPFELSDYKRVCLEFLTSLAIPNPVAELLRLYSKSHPASGGQFDSFFDARPFLYYLNELLTNHYENPDFNIATTSAAEVPSNPLLACHTLQNPKYLEKYNQFIRIELHDPGFTARLIPGYGLSLFSYNNFGPHLSVSALGYTSQSLPEYIASVPFRAVPLYEQFYNPVEQFYVRHKEMFKAEKAAGFWARHFKNTKITKAHTLEMILEHGANPKSRSFSVLNDLGWLNADGTPKAELTSVMSAPSPVASSSQ